MPLYRYWGFDHRGRPAQGSVSASTMEEARAELKGENRVILRLVPAPAETPLDTRAAQQFFGQLSLMLQAGLPLVQALDTLAQTAAEEPGGKAALVVSRAVALGGNPLSHALATCTGLGPLDLLLVRVGEQTGTLIRALDGLARRKELQIRRQGRWKAALVYPAFLFLSTLLMMALLIVFLVPRVTELTVRQGVPLPLPTRMLLLITHPLALKGGGLLLLLSAAVLVTVPSPLLIFARLPVIRGRVHLGLSARFATDFAALLEGGVTLDRALGLLATAGTGFPYFDQNLQTALHAVREGHELHLALEEAELPRLITTMAALGSEHDQLPQTLTRAADLLHTQLETEIDTLMQLMEPMLLCFCGFIAGFVCLAAFLPVYGLLTESS